MNDNFAPVPEQFSEEELLALEGYTPEKLEAFRAAAEAKILQNLNEAQARGSRGTAAKPEIEEPELKYVTVLLGNGNLITFSGVADLDFGSKREDGFQALYLLGADADVIAQFEPSTWAAYYYTDNCSGIKTP